VFLLELLTGIQPRYSDTGQLVSYRSKKKETDGEMITPSDYLRGLGDLSRSFVRQLLNPNPAARPSADVVLAHKWLDVEVKPEIDTFLVTALDAADDYQ
jgi:serine/threonine protein kinase